MTLIISLASIYFFILLGYVAKRIFPQNDDKTLVVLSIYFFQPLMIFWGLTRQKIDFSLWYASSWYGLINFLALGIGLVYAKYLFRTPQERSILTISPLLGNTGNLGIPLGIALWGESSILYTSMINLINVFFVYTVGVYIYSRGSFSIKDSLMNIVKMPVMGFALIAILCNYFNITFNHAIEHALEMGAYTSMVIQLIIFGFYLYSVKIRHLSRSLLKHVTLMKFIIIPLMGSFFLSWSALPSFVIAIIMLQLCVPLAVANVNLASLYDCKPHEVTALVLITSLVFIPYSFFLISWFFPTAP